MSNSAKLEEKNNEWLAAIMEKADLFDYLCWLENINLKKVDPGGLHACLASDDKIFFGKTYLQVVQKAANYDKHNF